MLDQTQTEILVRKRDGRAIQFDAKRILVAIQKAFAAEQGLPTEGKLDADILSEIDRLLAEIVSEVTARQENGEISVEQIQDLVEQELMRSQHSPVARRYILYRAEHAKIRRLRAEENFESDGAFPEIMVNREGVLENLDFERLRGQVTQACAGLDEETDAGSLFEEVEKQFFNKITPKEISRSMVLAARARIESDPAYDKVAARLVANIIYRESLGKSTNDDNLETLYREKFASFIAEGIEADRISPELSKFDLEQLSAAIVPERDELSPYLGLQTIYDRYLLHIDGRRIEAPQFFWMRVAMGLSIQEENRNESAIQFYNILSSMRFTSATPTLFNSGTLHPQLSSCYLSTVSDDLDHIFKCIADNAKLSKWAGGLGNDWTCLLYTSPSPRDGLLSRMPSSA